jgi:dephospho-CoA kinase
VAAKVFAQPDERQTLEKLVFPFIESGIVQEIAAGEYDPAAKFIILDAAIMLEAGWSKYVDKLVYVDAPRPTRVERLTNARGWVAGDVEARERAQWSIAEKKSRADAVIDNSGTPEELGQQVERLLAQWKLIARD